MEKVAVENKYNHYLYQAYKVQADHYEKYGQNDIALQKHKLYSKLVIQREKEKKKALSNHLVSETKKRDEERAKFQLNTKIQEEKSRQNNLNIVFFLILAILLIVGILLYNRYQRKVLYQRLKDKKNQLALMQSQIMNIGSQMNPHFIFNALNSVQDLIMQKDIRNSNIYLGKFADLMRKTLETSEKQTIQLDSEIEILDLYLESLRFNEDFKYSIEKKHLKYNNYEIPTMLIQPYVENAVKHGLLHKAGAKELRIEFKEVRGDLQCIIWDNGVGRKRSEEINKRRELNHNSFATKANDNRVDLINQTSKNKVKLEIIDLFDGEKAIGTKVVIDFLRQEGLNE